MRDEDPGWWWWAAAAVSVQQEAEHRQRQRKLHWLGRFPRWGPITELITLFLNLNFFVSEFKLHFDLWPPHPLRRQTGAVSPLAACRHGNPETWLTHAWSPAPIWLQNAKKGEEAGSGVKGHLVLVCVCGDISREIKIIYTHTHTQMNLQKGNREKKTMMMMMRRRSWDPQNFHQNLLDPFCLVLF